MRFFCSRGQVLSHVVLTDGRGEPLQQALDYGAIDVIKVRHLTLPYLVFVLCLIVRKSGRQAGSRQRRQYACHACIVMCEFLLCVRFSSSSPLLSSCGGSFFLFEVSLLYHVGNLTVRCRLN